MTNNNAHQRPSYWNWLFGLALIAATVLVYQPAWNGKPIWDDDIHITVPSLRSLSGLTRIWTDPAAAPQFYPVLHTVFWLEYKLWGAWPLPYHLVNILLHAFSALLLLRILQRLEIPGAWLAVSVFALHPVFAESVAWISELKNTLSGAFFFATALAYLRFDQGRRRSAYVVALTLFLVGLMVKTVIATLPAAILAVLWWKRRGLAWKRDVKPLIPFFAVGIAAGFFTAWVERRFCGAEGKAFDFSMIERFLIAGRAFWFYLGKLFWPANLVVIYPRWRVSPTAWWQYLFPVAVLLVFAALWIWRKRLPALLAALLFFAVMLFPMLSFLNISYFKFSFVADHFQYLASVGIIVFVAAGAAVSIARLRNWQRTGAYGLCLILVATLGGMTWRQSVIFRDPETCYRAILASNPDSALAHSNLGNVLLRDGRVDDAIVHETQAVTLQPESEFAHFNLALALFAKGRVDEAILHLEKVLEVNPNHPQACYTLANILADKGKTDQAMAYYQRTLKLDPRFVEARGSLGNVLLQEGQFDEAITQYQKIIEFEPQSATAHFNLAVALVRKGQFDAAVVELRTVLSIQPDYPDAKVLLTDTLARKAQP